MSWQAVVTYGAVGATQAPDLMTFPPAGFRPSERSARIGHGEARWEFARLQIMTWGVKTRSGFRIEMVDTPADVLDSGYAPVVFDDVGSAASAAQLEAEPEYGPDGTALVRAGETAYLVLGWGRLSAREPVRIVTVIDEPRRRGFAYGTLPGHPLKGEESFIVERRDDDTVWITIRSFSRPSSRFWWAMYPVLRLLQEVFTRRYLRALAGPIG